MSAPDYESPDLLDQYLLFHFGAPEQILPWATGPREALGFPARVVEDLIDHGRLRSNGATALDLGCAVGGSSFALARRGLAVTGIDLSQSFIEAAHRLAAGETLSLRRQESGHRFTTLSVNIDPGSGHRPPEFRVGDAMHPPLPEEDRFDVVLMANLLDRVPHPERALQVAAGRVAAAGQLLVASPYTWMESCTPPHLWLATPDEEPLEAMQRILGPDWELDHRTDLPFLIREHRRKFQWSVAEGTRWVRAKAAR